VPSEKYTARRGSVSEEMRMSTACFARALQRCTSRKGWRHQVRLPAVVQPERLYT